jgi:hypothetical protein
LERVEAELGAGLGQVPGRPGHGERFSVICHGIGVFTQSRGATTRDRRHQGDQMSL